jgi:hypothetical protein
MKATLSSGEPKVISVFVLPTTPTAIPAALARSRWISALSVS